MKVSVYSSDGRLIHSLDVDKFGPVKVVLEETSLLPKPCPGRDHPRHAVVTCEGLCCTACGGPIDDDEGCRCPSSHEIAFLAALRDT